MIWLKIGFSEGDLVSKARKLHVPKKWRVPRLAV
jgi:hypothetical protein